MGLRGDTVWQRAATVLALAAACAAACAAAVVEIGDAGDASTELLALIDRAPLAVLFDEERDCLDCDHTRRTFAAAAATVGVAAAHADVRAHPDVRAALATLRCAATLQRLPAIVLFNGRTSILRYERDIDDTDPLSLSQDDVAAWLRDMAGAEPVSARFHGWTGGSEPRVETADAAAQLRAGRVGPNSLGTVVALGVVVASCVALILWFMQRQLAAPPLHGHTD